MKNTFNSIQANEKDIILCLNHLDEMLGLWDPERVSLEPYFTLWNFFIQKLDSNTIENVDLP